MDYLNIGTIRNPGGPEGRFLDQFPIDFYYNQWKNKVHALNKLADGLALHEFHCFSIYLDGHVIGLYGIRP